MKKIRVGLIGARPDRGWAGTAHVTAIRAVPRLELVAVATRNDDSARAAARAFDVPLAFGDPARLIVHPDVDLVSVTVKAPAHRTLVLAAIDAGKAVYCEWPLGRTLQETAALAAAAQARGVATAIGLQGRSSPWVEQVRRLVADGYVGRVLSTTMVAADLFSTGKVAEGNAYMLDVDNGANALTIQAGHTIDTLCHVVGDFVDVVAQTTTMIGAVVVEETGAVVSPTSPDQVALVARLAGGGFATVHVRTGTPPGPTVHWLIDGDAGSLRITADSGYVHWSPLVVEGARRGASSWERLEPPATLFGLQPPPPPGPPHNVAYAYAAFAAALAGDGPVDGFSQALKRHRTIAAIAEAAATGRRTLID